MIKRFNEANRIAFLKDPCDACVSARVSESIRELGDEYNPSLDATIRVAARSSAMSRCAHVVDNEAVLSAPVSLYDVFGYGHRHGDSCPRQIEELQTRIDSGEVSLTRHVMMGLGSWNDPRVLEHFSGRSEEHRRMCAQAAMWLADRGNTWSSELDVLRYFGGIADVMSGDRSIACEAGYTNSGKVLRATSEGISVLVVPYPCETGLPIVAGFLFSSAGYVREAQNFDERNAAKGLL